MSAVPSIWLLEIRHLEDRLNETETVDSDATSAVRTKIILAYVYDMPVKTDVR